MEKTKVLIVEDDPYLGLIMKECFEDRHFESHLFKNGEEGLKGYLSVKPDICLLDVMMPIKDGFSLAKEIREIDKDVPIIFLTAKSMKEDIVQGFNIGADDYVKKPFSMEELILRVQAILKRSSSKTNDLPGNIKIYKIGKYTFDHEQQLLTIENSKKKLTHKEAELLKLLCDNLNNILDRNLVLKKVWGDDNFFNARSMDVYIVKLRKLLKEDPNIEIINIRGKGFKMLLDREA